MNRILKRPMFRMGGSSGTGITSGLDKPRQTYREAGEVTNTPSSKIPMTGFGVSALPGFLTQFGLNLLSQPPRGGIFSTAAEAAKDPFKRFQAAQFAEEQADKKFARDLALQLAKPTKPTIRQGVNRKTGERGFFTNEQILNNPDIVPPDNRMGFKVNTKTGVVEQVPYSQIEKEQERVDQATALGTQYNILSSLVNDMQTRLPGTATGPTGVGFNVIEGLSDQLTQLGESLGIREGLVIQDEGAIDSYLKDKGFTQKAQSAATMKASVINLGYALAKIAEPDNPRLSEGDIIRQLNRINFGSSRDVFSASLNQILKEELIRAENEIKGLKLNPEDFLTSLQDKKPKKDVKGQTDSTTVDDDPAGIRDYIR